MTSFAREKVVRLHKLALLPLCYTCCTSMFAPRRNRTENYEDCRHTTTEPRFGNRCQPIAAQPPDQSSLTCNHVCPASPFQVHRTARDVTHLRVVCLVTSRALTSSCQNAVEISPQFCGSRKWLLLLTCVQRWCSPNIHCMSAHETAACVI